MHHYGAKFLITRTDGVQAIACEDCLDRTPPNVIENAWVDASTACQTEIAPGAWSGGFTYRFEKITGVRHAG